MKRVLSFALAALLVLTGCAGKPQAPSKTPEELTQAYLEAVDNWTGEVRGVETVTSADDDMAEFVFGLLGLAPEDMTAYALSVSLMNVKAYGILLAMPAEGHEEAVKKGFQAFVDAQKTNFEQYLQDQYEVAKAAKVETLEDGTVVMVMCEDSDNVLEGIRKALG